MKASALVRRRQGSWDLRSSGEIPQFRRTCFGKTNEGVPEGFLVAGEPVEHKREPKFPIVTSEETANAKRSRVGFILIDSEERPVYANAEAIRILGYDGSPGNPGPLRTLHANRIRAILPQRKDVRQAEAHMEFISGRRHYLCRSFHCGARSSGASQVDAALVLERSVRGTIHAAVAKQFHLTRREQEAAELLTLGLTSKDIASRMRISLNTVKAYLHLIMVKMGVTTRSGIVGKIVEEAASWRT